jgi:nuclear autoantigenic sperm protein
LQREREAADLKGILADLAARVEELEAAVQEKESTKDALKAAFSRLAAQQGIGSSSAAAPSTASAACASSSVINLGTVGRGSKRITLQPTSAAVLPGTDLPCAGAT